MYTTSKEGGIASNRAAFFRTLSAAGVRLSERKLCRKETGSSRYADRLQAQWQRINSKMLREFQITPSDDGYVNEVGRPIHHEDLDLRG